MSCRKADKLQVLFDSMMVMIGQAYWSKKEEHCGDDYKERFCYGMCRHDTYCREQLKARKLIKSMIGGAR